MEIKGLPIVMVDGKKVEDGSVKVVVEGQKVTATIEDFSKLMGKNFICKLLQKLKVMLNLE